MSKSPNTRKKAPKAAARQGATVRKPAKTARRTATAGKSRSQPREGSNGARRKTNAPVRNGTKQAMLIDLLDSAGGASIPEMAAKAGWQHHSVRGFLSGTVKRKLGLAVASASVEGRGRVYRIAKGR